MNDFLDRFVRFVLILLAFFIAFRIEFEIKGASLAPVELMLIFLLAVTAYRFIRHPKDFDFKRIHLIPFLVFLLFAIPSRIPLLEIHGPVQGVWHLFRNFVELIPLMYLVLIFNLKGKDQIRSLVLILLTASGLSALIGIIQTFSQGMLLTGQGVYGNLNYLGIFPPYPSNAHVLARYNIGNVTIVTHTPFLDVFRATGGLNLHNYFGVFLVLTSTITLSLALYKRSIWLTGLAFIQFLGMAVSYSRAAYAGVFLSIAVLLFMRKKWARDLIVIGLLFVLVIGVLQLAYPEVFDAFIYRAYTIVNTPFDPPMEMEARLFTWKSSLHGTMQFWFNFFFGHGTGALVDVEFLGQKLTTHNDILDILYTRGFFSFIAWVVLLVVILKDGLRLFRNETDPFFKGLAAGAFAGILGVLVSGLNQSVLHVEETGILLWFIFGIIVFLRRRQIYHEK